MCFEKVHLLLKSTCTVVYPFYFLLEIKSLFEGTNVLRTCGHWLDVSLMELSLQRDGTEEQLSGSEFWQAQDWRVRRAHVDWVSTLCSETCPKEAGQVGMS